MAGEERREEGILHHVLTSCPISQSEQSQGDVTLDQGSNDQVINLPPPAPITSM